MIDHATAPDERVKNLIEDAIPGARILQVSQLGPDRADHGTTFKGAGYGVPLRIDLELAGVRKTVVLHTATPNGFGHDRRADRAAEALLLADTSSTIENHVRTLDVGAFRGEQGVVSLRDAGEFYVLTEWGVGAPYAHDLRRMRELGTASPEDVARCARLATYLARLHREEVVSQYAYQRSIRDLLGSGEGIFGIVDGYPPHASVPRLQRIESLCLDWRWRFKNMTRKLVRTHGDFHPFNVLFSNSNELRLLDTSRGSCGDGADDVTCMAINYVFFALDQPSLWPSVFQGLWNTFWQAYLESSGDAGVLDVAPPFLAWRGLVLASPVWYPDLSPEARERMLAFVEAALQMPRFDPDLAVKVFA